MRRLLAFASCALLGLAAWACANATSSLPPAAGAAQAASTVKVYYFHRTIRCTSCEKIERLAKRAVDQAFAAEVAVGQVEWHAVNIEDPQNMHFEEEYELSTQSVIVSEVRDGKVTRWKNLEKVWDLLQDDDALLRYVQGEIGAYLQNSRGVPINGDTH